MAPRRYIQAAAVESVKAKIAPRHAKVWRSRPPAVEFGGLGKVARRESRRDIDTYDTVDGIRSCV